MSCSAAILFKGPLWQTTLKIFKLGNSLNGVFARNLYSQGALGMDSYLQQKETVRMQMAPVTQRFKEKMKTYVESDSTTCMVFTEDLKNMVHLAEDSEDADLVCKMAAKFNQQNKELRFGNFVFGPVIFRMLHSLNKYEEAVKCFKSPELNGFFDQMISYQILLDLLYENQQYATMLEVFDIIREKQFQNIKFPKHPVVLVLAACYKLNTNESLDYALKLWSELMESGHKPMRRAMTFCAALATNQGKNEAALEMLSLAASLNYMTIRNIRLLALSNLGRLDDVILTLKNIILGDIPVTNRSQPFVRDVLDKIGAAIEAAENPDLSLEYNRILKNLEAHGQISNETLDDQLCQEIEAFDPKNAQNRMQRPQYSNVGRNRDFPNNRTRTVNFNRPGLSELQ